MIRTCYNFAVVDVVGEGLLVFLEEPDVKDNSEHFDSLKRSLHSELQVDS